MSIQIAQNMTENVDRCATQFDECLQALEDKLLDNARDRNRRLLVSRFKCRFQQEVSRLVASLSDNVNDELRSEVNLAKRNTKVGILYEAVGEICISEDNTCFVEIRNAENTSELTQARVCEINKQLKDGVVKIRGPRQLELSKLDGDMDEQNFQLLAEAIVHQTRGAMIAEYIPEVVRRAAS